MGIFIAERKKLTFDNENDRIILILLSLKNKRNCFEQKRYITLRNRYEDNDVYKDDIIEKLVNAGYVNAIDLEPDKPKRCASGGFIKHRTRYRTSKSGIRALKSGRFISEYNTIMWKRFGSGLQWTATVISVLGGALALYSRCQNSDAATQPTPYEIRNIPDSTIIAPAAIATNSDISAITPNQSKEKHKVRIASDTTNKSPTNE